MSFLACGDAHGFIKVFDVTGLQMKREVSGIILLHTFRAHHAALISAYFIKAPGNSVQGSSVLITAARQVRDEHGQTSQQLARYVDCKISISSSPGT